MSILFTAKTQRRKGMSYYYKRGTLVLFLQLVVRLLLAQSTNLPLQSPAQHILDRLLIQWPSAQNAIHAGVKPYARRDAVQLALTVDSLAENLTAKTRLDLQYLFDENNEYLRERDSLYFQKNQKPLFGIFYRTPAHFFEVNNPAFYLRANPILHFAMGAEQHSSERIFLNRRGIELRGGIDERVYFHTNIIETQARFPDYVNQWIQDYASVPGAGFYKNYDSNFFQIKDGYDYNLAEAYVGARITKHIGVELGHGQHFIGNGYRSLFLSDVGNYTYYLKFNTRVWRFHYQNLFFELSPISTAVPRPPNSILPKKYIAAHYLNFQATPNLAIGFYEATVFNRSRQFELQYLNPVILYRTVEGMIGSPDNVLLGFDARWNFLRRFQLYGQLLFDEFLLSELINPAEKGWWGNKFGWQTGLKYIDAFGIDHLDLQLEFNTVRPYTYSSFDSLNSYTHYNQPLAHPLWANFKEILGILRYQPHPRLLLISRLMHANAGENTSSENFGANPLLGNSSRVQEYGNKTGQGIQTTIFVACLDASWQLRHNLYLETQVWLRQKNSADVSREQRTRYFTLGLRWNIWNRTSDFF